MSTEVCYWCSKEGATWSGTAWHQGVAFPVHLHVKRCKKAWWEDAAALGTLDAPPEPTVIKVGKIKRKVPRPKAVA